MGLGKGTFICSVPCSPVHIRLAGSQYFIVAIKHSYNNPDPKKPLQSLTTHPAADCWNPRACSVSNIATPPSWGEALPDAPGGKSETIVINMNMLIKLILFEWIAPIGLWQVLSLWNPISQTHRLASKRHLQPLVPISWRGQILCTVIGAEHMNNSRETDFNVHQIYFWGFSCLFLAWH